MVDKVSVEKMCHRKYGCQGIGAAADHHVDEAFAGDWCSTVEYSAVYQEKLAVVVRVVYSP